MLEYLDSLLIVLRRVANKSLVVVLDELVHVLHLARVVVHSHRLLHLLLCHPLLVLIILKHDLVEVIQADLLLLRQRQPVHLCLLLEDHPDLWPFLELKVVGGLARGSSLIRVEGDLPLQLVQRPDLLVVRTHLALKGIGRHELGELAVRVCRLEAGDVVFSCVFNIPRPFLPYIAAWSLLCFRWSLAFFDCLR